MGSRHSCPDQRGANDQAQRCEGSAAVSDAGAVSPSGPRIRARAWAECSRPALWNQCSDDSSVAKTLASRRRRGAGAFLSPAPATAGGRRRPRAGPPGEIGRGAGGGRGEISVGGGSLKKKKKKIRSSINKQTNKRKNNGM